MLAAQFKQSAASTPEAIATTVRKDVNLSRSVIEVRQIRVD